MPLEACTWICHLSKQFIVEIEKLFIAKITQRLITKQDVIAYMISCRSNYILNDQFSDFQAEFSWHMSKMYYFGNKFSKIALTFDFGDLKLRKNNQL